MRSLAFIILAYAIGWGALWAGIASATGETDPRRFLSGEVSVPFSTLTGQIAPYLWAATLGPTLAALILIATAPAPLANLKAFALRIVRVKVHPFTYFLAILLTPLVYLGFLFALGVRPLEADTAQLLYITLFPVSALNGLIYVFTGPGPAFEEPGWRGYLLPRWLGARSDFTTSLMLGLIWTFFHTPLIIASPDWRGGEPLHVFLPGYIIFCIAISYMMTKIFRLSGGSVFLCIWLHGVLNFCINHATETTLWDYSGLPAWAPTAIGPVGVIVTASLLGLISASPFGAKRQEWR